MPGIGTAIGTAFAQGTHAARPAAATANQGYYYFETDTGGGTLFQSTGAAWVQLAGPVTGAGLTNPMTTQDDLIVGGAAGAAARLGKGTSGQVLTVDATSGHLAWDTPASAAGSKWLTLPAGWDAAWVAAKAALATTPAWIAVIGDSVSQGMLATDILADGYFGLLRTHLLASYALYADYYPVVDSAAYATFIVTTWAGTPPWAFTGSSQFGDNGYSRSIGWSGNLSTAGLGVFTAPAACTRIDLLYLDFAPGTWTYHVDGDSDVTVTNTGNSTTANAQVKRVSLTGLANTTHTVTFGNQSAAFVLNLVGCAAYAGTTGLGFVRGAYGDGSMALLAEATANPADKLRLWQGVEPQGDATATSATGFGFPTQPSLAIIAMGINDTINGTSQATYQAGLARLIAALRRGQANCSILILAPCFPDAVSSDQPNPWTNSAGWYSFLVAMQQLAASFNCAFANVHAKWGETPYGSGFTSSASPHPVNAGHADIATLLESVL